MKQGVLVYDQKSERMMCGSAWRIITAGCIAAPAWMFL